MPALSSSDPVTVVVVMVVGSALALLFGVGLATLAWGRAEGPPRRRRTRAQPPVAAPVRARTDPAALRREAQRLTGYALDAARRAQEALAEVARTRERLAVAETIRDDAWHTYDTSESPLLVPSGATALEPLVAGESAQREITHAAFVAYREGAITVRELQQVWTGTDGVDPGADQRREVAGRQRDARRDYDRAATNERLAAEQVRIAEVAAAALAAEAQDAEREAQAAQALADRYARSVGPARSGPARSGRARPGRAKSGGAKSGGAKSGGAKSVGGKSRRREPGGPRSVALSGGTKSAPARPEPAKSSPANVAA